MNLKTVLLSIVLAGIVYLAFAFGNWDWNPGKWDVGLRYLTSIIMMFCFIVPVVFKHLMKN